MMNRYWNINRLSSNHCEPLFTIIIPLYSWICDPGNPKNHSYSPQKVFPEVSIGKTMSTISSFGVHVSLYIMYTYIYIHMYLYVSLWHDYLKKMVMNLAFNTIVQQGSWTQTLQRAMKPQLEHIGKNVFQVPSSAHLEDFIITYPPVN
jgi:hypothetical protein